jgi:predicted DsbA family dithiol-disulfide isomerase
MARYNNDVKSEKVLKTIQDVASLAEKVQIRGVPALILNGRQLQTIEAEGIQAEIDSAK